MLSESSLQVGSNELERNEFTAHGLLVTSIITGILRHFSHNGCGTIFRRFHLNLSTAVPGVWQRVEGKRLLPATLRQLTATWKPGLGAKPMYASLVRKGTEILKDALLILIISNPSYLIENKQH